MGRDRARHRGDIVGGLLFLLVGVGVVVETSRLRIGTPLHPQPGFFPFLGGVVLIGLACVLMVRGWLGRGHGAEAFGEVRRPAILVASLVVYVGIFDPVGYVLATTFIAGVILRILGVASWRVLGVASVALSVGMYLLFARILGIELPAGVLEFLG